MLAVCQLLAGFCASPGLSVGTGMIADVWPSSSRAIPMAVYLAAPFCGPALGLGCSRVNRIAMDADQFSGQLQAES